MAERFYRLHELKEDSCALEMEHFCGAVSS